MCHCSSSNKVFIIQIIPYQYIKINYTSVINWKVTTDIVRTNPHFHNQPRYDYVLLQASAKDYIFAQLLYTFRIWFNNHSYDMALILPMDVPIIQSQNPNRQSDIDLRFKRLQARPRSGSVVISLESLVQGALLIKAYGAQYNDEYIVMDTIDSDMWWRMKSIKLSRSKVNFY